MSVSSHLTPEPERRLWLILESARAATEWNDKKIAALTAFAAAEWAVLQFRPAGGIAETVTLAALTAAMALGAAAFSPLTGKPRWHPFSTGPGDKPRSADNLVSVDDLAKYSHGELIARLDFYLGGGITATQYYEDIVGQIVVGARLATRKGRLFRAGCALVGLAQLALFSRLF
jgi:hypothetical protein